MVLPAAEWLRRRYEKADWTDCCHPRRNLRKEKATPLKTEKEPAVGIAICYRQRVFIRVWNSAIEKNNVIERYCKWGDEEYLEKREWGVIPRFPFFKSVALLVYYTDMYATYQSWQPFVWQGITFELSRCTHESGCSLPDFPCRYFRPCVWLRKMSPYRPVRFQLLCLFLFLTLAVPSASDARMRLCCSISTTLKVTFKHQTAESFIIPTYNHLHTSIVLYLQHIAVLCRWSGTRTWKIVLDDIPDILGGTLLEQRFALFWYDFVFFSSHCGSRSISPCRWDVRFLERDVFPEQWPTDGEIDSVIRRTLRSDYRFTFPREDGIGFMIWSSMAVLVVAPASTSSCTYFATPPVKACKSQQSSAVADYIPEEYLSGTVGWSGRTVIKRRLTVI